MRLNSRFVRQTPFVLLLLGGVFGSEQWTRSLAGQDRQPGPVKVALDQGLVGYWTLSGDAQDHSGEGHHAEIRGDVDFLAVGPSGKPGTAARFDGQGDFLTVPVNDSWRLGTGDFTIAAWVQATERSGDVPGDLVSWYDPQRRRGFHLTLKTQSVTTSVANDRHLQFGIDDDRPGNWIDCGRPGQALLAFALAVHQGELYAGTCEPGSAETGHVHRYAGDGNWIDCGAPDGSNAVTSLAVFDGHLFAGTGKYRVAGSALPESENAVLGGRIFRYAGERNWIDCGQLPNAEAIGGMVVFQGRLYASSLYRPAGFYRYEGESHWTDCGTPDGKRVVALGIHDGFLYGTSYDGGHVYRYDGESWTDCGLLGENTQTYSFAPYQGRWHVGTWPSGRVYRFEEVDRWTDVGRLGEELEVMGMLVHNGRLLAGTLPLAEVHQYDGDAGWRKLTRLDHTPDVKYRRAWTMAEHAGRVYCSTLPSGKIFSFAAGTNVMYGHPFPSGWHHAAAARNSAGLTLYLDGKPVAAAPHEPGPPMNLEVDVPLRIGMGANDSFHGELSEVRVYNRTLKDIEIRHLAKRPAF